MDLKIKTAVFHAPANGQYSSVEIHFEGGREAWLDSDMKWTLLEQGIVCLSTGWEDLPTVYYKDKSNKIALRSCTKDAAVLKVARRYKDHLAGELELKEGDSLI